MHSLTYLKELIFGLILPDTVHHTRIARGPALALHRRPRDKAVWFDESLFFSPLAIIPSFDWLCLEKLFVG